MVLSRERVKSDSCIVNGVNTFTERERDDRNSLVASINRVTTAASVGE